MTGRKQLILGTGGLNMSDYISRDAALKAAEHAYGEWNLAMAAADGARQINLVYKRQ